MSTTQHIKSIYGAAHRFDKDFWHFILYFPRKSAKKSVSKNVPCHSSQFHWHVGEQVAFRFFGPPIFPLRKQAFLRSTLNFEVVWGGFVFGASQFPLRKIGMFEEHPYF